MHCTCWMFLTLWPEDMHWVIFSQLFHHYKGFRGPSRQLPSGPSAEIELTLAHLEAEVLAEPVYCSGPGLVPVCAECVSV